MGKNISTNLRDLLTRKSQQHISDDMMSDIYYVIQCNSIKNATLNYDNKVILIKKIETGGTYLQLIVDDKNIEVIPK